MHCFVETECTPSPHFLCDGVTQFVVMDMAFPVAHGLLLHVLGEGFSEVDAGLVG